MSAFIDISIYLENRMQHWPGDPAPEFALHRLHMHPHTGTHIDAPLHYVAGGASMDSWDPEATVGPARVVRVEADAIDADVLRTLDLQKGERVLFRTWNSERCWCGSCFRKQFVAVTPDGAHVLAECGVRTVGIDYLSIGPYGTAGDETHRIVLRAGIWVIEGLDLRSVEPGPYELTCLPLKIKGGDGAPARALLRRPQPASYSGT
jgi:arylformamidase